MRYKKQTACGGRFTGSGGVAERKTPAAGSLGAREYQTEGTTVKCESVQSVEGVARFRDVCENPCVRTQQFASLDKCESVQSVEGVAHFRDVYENRKWKSVKVCKVWWVWLISEMCENPEKCESVQSVVGVAHFRDVCGSFQRTLKIEKCGSSVWCESVNWCELDRNVEESVAEVWCGSVQNVVSVARLMMVWASVCGVKVCKVW